MITKTKNQIKKMGNDIEEILNDFEGGITEKEETIINIIDYILERVEVAVSNYRRDFENFDKVMEREIEKNCLPVEAQVGKNLAEENKEGLTEWRTILLNEKHHSLLKHILEIGIKDGWLANEETKKLLRIITTAEKMDYYVGRKLTKAKLD